MYTLEGEEDVKSGVDDINHDRKGGVILCDRHVDVEVETILRGEGNQTSNLAKG